MPDLNNLTGFDVAEMTAAINRIPAIPTRIGSLGLFGEQGVTTHSVTVEERNGVLSLLTDQPRGGPIPQAGQGTRRIRTFRVPHFPLGDVVTPAEFQGVRSFGSENQLESLQEVVTQKLTTIRAAHDATREYVRIGAAKGVILDGSGTTLYNLFTEFGVTQTSVDFVLGTTGTDIRAKCIAVKRAMEDELGAAAYQRVHAICGKTFFDRLVAHAEVKETYKYQQGQVLRSDVRAGLVFGDITFEEYNGKVGSTSFVADSECHFFPVGVPGLFVLYNGPANTIQAANTIGEPFYASQEPMPHGRGLSIYTESNPLAMCTIPKVLVKGTTSN
jgi:hypothetical protein